MKGLPAASQNVGLTPNLSVSLARGTRAWSRLELLLGPPTLGQAPEGPGAKRCD